MCWWQQILTTAIGAFLGFASGLTLFWIKESVESTHKKQKAIKNLLYEFEYNLTLLADYKKKITECMESVSAEKRKVYLDLNYEFMGVHFAKRFYNEGYLSDFLHQDDMKQWNHFLSKLSPGSEQLVLDEVEKWREGAGSKVELHDIQAKFILYYINPYFRLRPSFYRKKIICSEKDFHAHFLNLIH